MRAFANYSGLLSTLFIVCAWLGYTQLVRAQDLGTFCTDPTETDCIAIADISADLCANLFPVFPSVGLFLAGPLLGSCSLFTSTDCEGDEWAVGITIEDFSKVNFNGVTPKDNIQSYRCSVASFE
ncbi:hypothetical protein NM688_g5402 [Phlebia brevispora]|uniref:Uncharacterized protein n=1 Tax=Phlebia brevispora TaxID=194682 RepID=A0ACC1SWE2_9APHY|nr:hypothetical protein NM688_g5402 [Phlebia brevispora]